MYRGIIEIIYAGNDRVPRDRISAQHQFIDERDGHIVIGTDDGARQASVFADEKVCHFRALVGPVVTVEDHVFRDLVTGFMHRIFKAGQTLMGIIEIIAAHNKADISAVAFSDHVFGDLVHDLAVVGDDRIKARFLGTDTYDRRKIESGSEVLEKFIVQAGMMQRVRT